MATRRKRIRARSKNSNTALIEYLDMKLREERSILKRLIAVSKSRMWDDLLRTVDRDPWGKPFKIVMSKLRPGGASAIGREEALEVLGSLFPEDPLNLLAPSETAKAAARRDTDPTDLEVTPVEVRTAIKTGSRGKAPGPDAIPLEVVDLIAETTMELLTNLFTKCLRDLSFPRNWKKAHLVLIPKPGSANAYRPISLIDSVAKIFERILADRILGVLAHNHRLNDNQFGFRRGKSTTDALNAVADKIRRAKIEGKVAIAVSLDIKNAFNTAKWSKIMQALEQVGVPPYLQLMVRDYLSERTITYKAGTTTINRNINMGVPQGSVFGPLLWNIMFHGVMEACKEPDTAIYCYADDTLVLTWGKNREETARKTNRATAQVVTWIAAQGLDVAAYKTQVIMFAKGAKALPETKIRVEGQDLEYRKDIKYLGLLLDNRLCMTKHVEAASTKALRVTTKLAGIMPNVGGPKPARKKLYAHIGESIALYGAPVWADNLSKKAMNSLSKVRRAGALRVTSAYRTVSAAAAEVIAGLPPLDMLALHRSKLYKSKADIVARADLDSNQQRTEVRRVTKLHLEALANDWQDRWRLSASGSWTRKLIPDLRPWVNRRHGEVSYTLTQALSGHGAFGAYLKKFGRRPTNRCLHCDEGVEDTVEHTLYTCQRWERARRTSGLGGLPPAERLVMAMLDSEDNWRQIANAIAEIINEKESEERRMGW